ncbi:hypothetical protein Pan216_18370 [Planctomycetes bacterium Pan216]|uniref:DUF4136 domain-containing protein n=1 Tax=Kolteria novifilia TaxID=2527975 RepID=A0A518B1Y0_9BACT|nr:hypothetical protein Pan216_18370 [Planctomycetes bacterium Pan216]
MHGLGRASLILLALTAGCVSVPATFEDPTTVSCDNFDLVWETTVDVLERYFEIGYENRYDGRIETQPLSAATWFEPWRHDSIGFEQRLEASLQTIRRRAFVLIQPAPTGGFTILVEVYKELEDLPQNPTSFLGETGIITSIEPTTETLVTSAVPVAAGWISLGRDPLLEYRIIEEIHKKLGICGCTPCATPGMTPAMTPGVSVPAGTPVAVPVGTP